MQLIASADHSKTACVFVVTADLCCKRQMSSARSYASNAKFKRERVSDAQTMRSLKSKNIS